MDKKWGRMRPAGRQFDMPAIHALFLNGYIFDLKLHLLEKISIWQLTEELVDKIIFFIISYVEYNDCSRDPKFVAVVVVTIGRWSLFRGGCYLRFDCIFIK